MTTVSGILRDAKGMALPGVAVTLRYVPAVIGYSGGAVAKNNLTYLTDDAGLLSMPGLVSGPYDMSIAMPIGTSATVTSAVTARLIVNGEATQTLEDALQTTIGEITPTILSQAIAAATSAQAAADEAALYDGPKADNFAGLAAVTPSMLAIGGLIRVIETGAVYQRVSSGGDLNYTGSGGVRLNVLSTDLRAFGCEFGSGKTLEVRQANLRQLAVAAARHAILGGTLAGAGRLEIAGSDDVAIFGSVDFSSLTFGVAGFTGTITFANDYTEVVYSAGSAVLNAAKAATTLQRNSQFIDTFVGLSAVEDAMVWIDTNQPFYGYRAAIINRTDLVHSLRDGFISRPLEYDINPATITAVRVRKNNKHRSHIRMGTVDFTGCDAASPLGTTLWPIKVSTSNATVEGLHIINETGELANYSARALNIDGNCNVTIKDITANFVANKTDHNSIYALRYANMIGCRIEDVFADGNGWGASAGHECCVGLLFQNCHMSRYDWHAAARSGVTLTGCRIGTWGLYLTGTGPLVLDQCAFQLADLRDYNKAVLLGTRSDTLGFWDGDMTMRDCRVTGVDAQATESGVRLGRAYLWRTDGLTAQGDPTGTITAMSPITHRLFRSVTIDGLINDSDVPIQITPIYRVDPTNPVKTLERINGHDLVAGRAGKGFEIECRTSGWSEASTSSITVDLDGVDFETFAFHSQDATKWITLTARRLRPVAGGDGSIYVTMPGQYRFDDCTAYRIMPLDNALTPPAPISFIWTGGSLLDLAGASAFVGIQNSSIADFKFLGVHITAASEARVRQIYRGKVLAETVVVSGSVIKEIELAPAPVSDVYTLAQTDLCEGSTFYIKCTGPSGTTQYIPVTFPVLYDSVPLPVWTGSNMALAYLRRTGASTLTVTGHGSAALGALVALTGKGT